MERYQELTGKEQAACKCICALASLYDVELDFNKFPRDPIYTRKLAAVMIGHVGYDLRNSALVSREGMYEAGFGLLANYIKKISALL